MRLDGFDIVMLLLVVGVGYGAYHVAAKDAELRDNLHAIDMHYAGLHVEADIALGLIASPDDGRHFDAAQSADMPANMYGLYHRDVESEPGVHVHEELVVLSTGKFELTAKTTGYAAQAPEGSHIPEYALSPYMEVGTTVDGAYTVHGNMLSMTPESAVPKEAFGGIHLLQAVGDPHGVMSLRGSIGAPWIRTGT